ncbi:MAG: putative transrane protein [Polaromonas sp.]|nr:putative transrane protein [Polaromonas sp.]
MNNDIVTIEPDEGLKTWGWISYLLHLVVAVAAILPGAQVSIALLIVALVIDLVKRSDATNTWQASHFSWRISSVLWAGILYLLTSWLWLLFIIPGMIAWGLISIWFLYRIVKGMVRMNAGRAVEAA